MAKIMQAEDEIEDAIKKFIPKKYQPDVMSVGSSDDMNHLKQLLSNTVTAAHADTCTALDRVVEEADALLARLKKAVEAHKQMLQNEGQGIAVKLESAVQELTRTVEWAERQGPSLRNPELRPEEPKMLEPPAA